jgi:hypothetical protein
MGREEATSFQVHPNDEQSQINLMQKFHWNLLGTQEIKTVDSHMEQRGDSIYSVTNSEHYVKLSFKRELDLPNLKEIKQLEQRYTSLPNPVYPKMFPGSIWLWVIGAFLYGIGIIGWLIYFFLLYGPKKTAAEALAEQNRKKRSDIMNELEKYE